MAVAATKTFAAAAAMLLPAVAHAFCWDKAASYYYVNPDVLRAIAQQESGLNPTAIRKNKNGSVDRGPMQINSRWLPALRHYGIGENELMDPCVNVMVGAWILRMEMQKYGNSWEAISAYHSPTPARGKAYAHKIQRHLLEQRGGATDRSSGDQGMRGTWLRQQEPTR